MSARNLVQLNRLLRLILMFRVKLHIFAIVLQADIKQHLSLRIKKGHWHYPLIEQVQSHSLNFEHEVEFLEETNAQPSFDLQLISKTQESKGLLYGSMTVKLLQWPMDRPKRQKIKLSAQIWMDLQLSYEYTPFSDSTSSLDDELPEIEVNQKLMEAEDENKFLKQKLKELQHQFNHLNDVNRMLQERKKDLTRNKSSFERETQGEKQREESQRREMSKRLERANYGLTSLMNLVIGKADVQTIAAVNLILQSDNK